MITRLRGFTLLEILIATAILTIGLSSIVALFPVAINLGRQVVEVSNSVVVAQSVAEAIRDGIRNRKRFITRNNVTQAYFVLRHDGVTDRAPADPVRERPEHDYYILLPRFGRAQSFGGGTESASRVASLRAGKTFLYPEADEPRNGNGDAFRADDDADDDGDDDFWTLKVTKVYQLGGRLNLDSVPEGSRVPDLATDVLRQYSFAFTITPSYFDADLSRVGDYQPANRLYHVRVMIFRGYVYSEYAEPPKPIYELDFEVTT
jgi:prepilin-type N-terminal cleavage/methylation domain-containing protein